MICTSTTTLVCQPGSAFSLRVGKGKKECNLLARQKDPSHRTQNVVETSYFWRSHPRRGQFSTFNLKNQREPFPKDIGIYTPKSIHNMQNISQAYHNSFCRDRTLCGSDVLQELLVRMEELFGQWPDTAGTNVSLDTQMHCCRFGHTDIIICSLESQHLLSFSLLLYTCTFFSKHWQLLCRLTLRVPLTNYCFLLLVSVSLWLIKTK